MKDTEVEIGEQYLFNYATNVAATSSRYNGHIVEVLKRGRNYWEVSHPLVYGVFHAAAEELSPLEDEPEEDRTAVEQGIEYIDSLDYGWDIDYLRWILKGRP